MSATKSFEQNALLIQINPIVFKIVIPIPCYSKKGDHPKQPLVVISSITRCKSLSLAVPLIATRGFPMYQLPVF